jgi:hypothetical protein
VEGPEESLANSVAFLFPVADVRCEVVVLRFRVVPVGRFFFPLVAISALKKPGEKFPLDKVLMKACCSSCVSMTPSTIVQTNNHRSI